MQAILMAGGQGTRLRPYTAVLPKPLVPIGDWPIMGIVMRQLRHFGFEKVTIAVGYKAEIIMAVIGDGSKYGLDISYHIEKEPLGTIGALATIENLDDDFLVMNGDICTNLNFKEVLLAHKKNKTVATVSTYLRTEKLELGVLDINESNSRIIGFREKPSYDFSVAMGVNAFSKDILRFIPANQHFGFDNLMDTLLAADKGIGLFQFGGLWHDIGRPDDYNNVLSDFEDNRSLYLPGED